MQLLQLQSRTHTNKTYKNTTRVSQFTTYNEFELLSRRQQAEAEGSTSASFSLLRLRLQLQRPSKGKIQWHEYEYEFEEIKILICMHRRRRRHDDQRAEEQSIEGISCKLI